MDSTSKIIKQRNISLSIIIPTYNESQNIVDLLDSIRENINTVVHLEVIVVDDNSPDGTAEIVEDYARKSMNSRYSIKIIERPGKCGLSSAILEGIRYSSGKMIVVMDSDLSHPAQTIPRMISELQSKDYDIVVASRYVNGGSISGWPFKRRILSKGAIKIVRHGLGVEIKDPMSGFFAFNYGIIDGIEFDAIGYKMLLEILVKTKGARVKEIPYTFVDRRYGKSKLDTKVTIDYLKSVWKLYRFGRQNAIYERRNSVRFLSKASRFYTIGASGLLVNYIVSFLLTQLNPGTWYVHATVFGIVASVSSNFVLNKAWTFEDTDFSIQKTLRQYAMFGGFSAFGAMVQLCLLILLVDFYKNDYGISLVTSVTAASISNFILNKRWTFRERVWS